MGANRIDTELNRPNTYQIEVDMLNDLNWLATGQPFPPTAEIERLERYESNNKIFNNEHPEVYKEQLKLK